MFRKISSTKCFCGTPGVALLALLLLAPLSDFAAAAEGFEPGETIGLAEADFTEAVSQYRKRDYQASFPMFDRLARTGHAEARYYLGIMYALGQGSAHDWEQAYMWLSCVADSPVNENLRVDANRQRALVRRKLGFEAVQRARQLEKEQCVGAAATVQTAEADRVLYNPVRSTLVDQAIFSAGDVILVGIMIAAQRLDLTLVQNLGMSTYRFFGDWFIGLLSLLWWSLFARTVYLACRKTGGLRGARGSRTVSSKFHSRMSAPTKRPPLSS
jgi:hypothetical protein